MIRIVEIREGKERGLHTIEGCKWDVTVRDRDETETETETETRSRRYHSAF